MGKRQKKLMDMLESVWLLDIQLRPGCLIKRARFALDPKTSKETTYCERLSIVGNEPRDGIFFLDSHGICIAKITKIIWQYDLWDILQLLAREYWFSRAYFNDDYLEIHNNDWKFVFRFDISIPPMDWDDLDNRKLVLFLESL